MKTKSIVLLSAGLDSSVNLFQAHQETEVLLALTFDYGQRAARKEIERAQGLCRLLAIPHRVLDLSWFADFTKTSLLRVDQDVPRAKEVRIDSVSQSRVTANRVWVPNRNGIFLNIAAGFAEGLGAQWVIPGFNAEEATTFADNSQLFLDRLDQAFELSTATQVKTRCFTTNMSKTAMVKMARGLNVPLNDLWPCYFGGESWCGECESCLRFQRALKEA